MTRRSRKEIQLTGEKRAFLSRLVRRWVSLNQDSGSAAVHYREGGLLPVCPHNLTDIHRMWELGELLRRFVSSRDISEKKL